MAWEMESPDVDDIRVRQSCDVLHHKRCKLVPNRLTP